MLRKNSVIIAIAVMLLAGCGASDGSSGGDNKDPQKGWVEVTDGLYKTCDGTTMIYDTQNGDTSTPNAPECSE